LVTTVQDAAALPVPVGATDPNIHYLGRFDRAKGDPRCSWTACTVVLKFHGTDLNAQLEDAGRSYWVIEIDGKPVQKIALGTGSHLYQIASGLPSGPHTVRLVRSSEPEWGPTQIHGFQLNQGATLLPPAPAPVHRLEVIGDSISCGNDMEGPQNDPENLGEDGYKSYGAVAARRLGLEYRCAAWSGRKMWPNKTVPEIYDLTIATEKESKWDFAQWSPDAILINLSTNDFRARGPVPFDQAGWVAGYEKFLGVLRAHFPKAYIYCASSPMLTGDRLTLSKSCLHKIVTDRNAAGDANVRYFEFDHEDLKDGIGVANHPNAKTHERMGEKLAGQLTTDLGWAPVAP
jgi:lysophospholipase L1-like esterase